MTRAMIAAALLGLAFSGETARGQEWGGAAGVIAMRGYTASPRVRMTSYDVVAPTGEEAPRPLGDGAPAADATAAAPRHRRATAGRAPQARAGRRSRHRPTA